MIFSLAVAAVAIVAGAIAAVAGFGIGSLLTPLLAAHVDTKTAVAAVSIPHLVTSAVRYWRLHAHVDRRVLWSFGLTSAAGGLLGALLQVSASSRVLAIVFGSLLLFASLAELTGFAERLRFGPRAAWVAGAASGMLGGLVGNQGGIRAGAMLGFSVPKHAFVATATAIALFVDVARVPVYIITQGDAIAQIWRLLAVATIGGIIGTFVGERVLSRMPETIFRRVVALLIGVLGLAMLVSGAG